MQMAKRGKSGPVPRPRPHRAMSFCVRSMESLGRIIGSLQRQLDGAADAALKRRRRARAERLKKANGKP
jgi:hypothetical protein